LRTAGKLVLALARGYEKAALTHAPGKCRQNRRGRGTFSGHVSAEDQASGFQDVNRYAPLQSFQRTIENELADPRV